jgi:hypothetical protein
VAARRKRSRSRSLISRTRATGIPFLNYRKRNIARCEMNHISSPHPVNFSLSVRRAVCDCGCL